MGNSYFEFREFRIEQDRCAMKVGTDGVLLGAWSRSDGTERILDVGTGTGLIALMMAQSNPCARITAIEIDRESAEQAQENVSRSKFKSQIDVIHNSLQSFNDDEGFDLVICNPPYFQQSTRSPDLKRSVARHEATMSISDLTTHAYRLLSDTGRLAIIIPISRFEEASHEASSVGFYLRRSCKVIPNPYKRSKRLLLEFSKVDGSHEEEELRIEDTERHVYTEEFTRLTAPFYRGRQKEKDGTPHPL